MVLAAGCPEEETYDNNAMKVFVFSPLSSHQSLFFWIISHSATTQPDMTSRKVTAFREYRNRNVRVMNSAPKPIEPSNNLQSCFIYIRGGGEVSFS